MTNEKQIVHLARELANLGEFIPAPMPHGTDERQAQYKEFSKLAHKHNQASGFRSKAGLTPALIGLENKRVEVVTTYGETRRFWVGKSTGWIPCHLEVHNTRSRGGGSAEYEYKSVRVVREK